MQLLSKEQNIGFCRLGKVLVRDPQRLQLWWEGDVTSKQLAIFTPLLHGVLNGLSVSEKLTSTHTHSSS